MRCPISQRLFVDPVMVDCCSKTFSRKPLEDWIRRVGKCKNCLNTSVKNKQYKPNIDLERFVTKFKRKCERKGISYHIVFEGDRRNGTSRNWMIPSLSIKLPLKYQNIVAWAPSLRWYWHLRWCFWWTLCLSLDIKWRNDKYITLLFSLSE